MKGFIAPKMIRTLKKIDDIKKSIIFCFIYDPSHVLKSFNGLR
ncbi:protein of unknown function [Paenibacillus alvei]|uniref:Uncharacterized protein n=1 Tax=Paenibacillus alvei TaxID=44250 RepID=A0A383R966_PAEAL|nr:protein of unknown function [Paenibacillus alvei]